MSDSRSTKDTSPSGERRLSDADRSGALEALGKHLSDGRIDVGEFEGRSAMAAAATRESDLRPAFEGLGGVPAMAASGTGAGPAPDPEIDRIRARGRIAENIDWIGVVLAIGFSALFLATGWAPPGLGLLAIAVCSIGGRIVLGFDEDTEYEALKKADRRRRLERIEDAERR